MFQYACPQCKQEFFSDSSPDEHMGLSCTHCQTQLTLEECIHFRKKYRSIRKKTSGLRETPNGLQGKSKKELSKWEYCFVMLSFMVIFFLFNEEIRVFDMLDNLLETILAPKGTAFIIVKLLMTLTVFSSLYVMYIDIFIEKIFVAIDKDGMTYQTRRLFFTKEKKSVPKEEILQLSIVPQVVNEFVEYELMVYTAKEMISLGHFSDLSVALDAEVKIEKFFGIRDQILPSEPEFLE